MLALAEFLAKAKDRQEVKSLRLLEPYEFETHCRLELR